MTLHANQVCILGAQLWNSRSQEDAHNSVGGDIAKNCEQSTVLLRLRE